MTSIRCTCGLCGDTNLTEEDILVHYCIDTGTYSYTFRCLECGRRIAKDCKPRIAQILLSAGCDARYWFLPDELEEPHDGPVITADDALDAVGVDWDAELSQMLDAS